ncbi:MAG: VOC family protein [Dehalococcoidia bacterium]|nr:VOC family protein [Dehalococcoidia bacterium]
MIPAQDADRAVEFYRDALGFKFLFLELGGGMAFFGHGGVRLFIGEPETGQEFSNGRLVNLLQG